MTAKLDGSNPQSSNSAIRKQYLDTRLIDYLLTNTFNTELTNINNGLNLKLNSSTFNSEMKNYETTTDNHAYITANYYTQTYLNNLFSGIYTVNQVDNLTTLTNFYNKTYIDSLISNYITSTQINGLTTLTNFYNKTYIDSLISNYLTSSQINALASLLNFYNKTDINNTLTGYGTLAYINSQLATISGSVSTISGDLSNVYTKLQVDSLLTSYEQKIDMSNYKTITSFNLDISNFYTQTQVNALASLTNFYNKTNIDTLLSGYELKSDLSNYKTIASFNLDIENYYTQTQVNALASLTNFYNKTYIDSLISNYVSSSYLTTNYTNTSGSQNYVNTQISNNNASYTTTTNLNTILTGYATVASLSSVSGNMANYVLTTTANNTYTPMGRINPAGPFSFSGQGAYLGWNLDGGGGKTYFSNFRGQGSGGFVFQNYDISGNIINNAMELDVSGNLTTIGNMTTIGGMTCPTLIASTNAYIGSGTGQGFLTSYAGDFYVEVNGGAFKVNQWMSGVNLFTVDHIGNTTIVGALNGITQTQLSFLTTLSSDVQTQLDYIKSRCAYTINVNNQITTRYSYVDDAAVLKLNLTGGTLTGSLTSNSQYPLLLTLNNLNSNIFITNITDFHKLDYVANHANSVGCYYLEVLGDATCLVSDIIFYTSTSSLNPISSERMRIKNNGEIIIQNNLRAYGDIYANTFNLAATGNLRVAVLLNGVLAESTVSTTTLGYLDATSSIQNQLNTINASYLPIFGGTLLNSLSIQKSNNIGLFLSNNSTSAYFALAYSNGAYNTLAVPNDLIIRNDGGSIILSSSYIHKDFVIDTNHKISTYSDLNVGGNLTLVSSGFLSTISYPPICSGASGVIDAGIIINNGVLYNVGDINIMGYSCGLNYELNNYYGVSPFNPGILNFQYNFRSNNGSIINTAQPGACFRIDSRTPSSNLFQWINRDAGSAIETIVATLDSTGLFKSAGLFTTGGAGNFGFIASGSNLYVSSLVGGVGYFNMNSGAYTATSDERLKENINIIDEMVSIDIIKNLNPKYYNYKSDGEKKVCVGFIAQEVIKVSPNSVESHDNKYAQIQNMLTLNKDDIFVHNVNATKNIISHLEVVDKSTIELYTIIQNQSQNIKILHGDLMYANQTILSLTNTITDLTSQINDIKSLLTKFNIV